MQDVLNDEIEEAIELREGAAPVAADNLTARLLRELIADELPRPERPSRTRAPKPERRKDIYVDLMGDDERRAYKAQLQRDRRAKLKAKLDEDNVVVFDANSARDALADAAVIILAKDLPGADQVRKYLAGVYRTQPGALLTLEGRIKSGGMKPKLIKYTQPKST